MTNNNEQMYLLNENRFNKPALNAETKEEMKGLISLGYGNFVRVLDDIFVTYISIDPISWEKESVRMYKAYLNSDIF